MHDGSLFSGVTSAEQREGAGASPPLTEGRLCSLSSAAVLSSLVCNDGATGPSGPSFPENLFARISSGRFRV